MPNSNRHEWTFTYTTADLLNALQQRLLHHQSRLAYWQEEMAKRDADLRTNGINVRNETASATTTSSTVVFQPPILDAQKTNLLREAQTKVHEHEEKVKEYTQWHTLLSEETKSRAFSLTLADALFFGVV